MTDLFRFFSDSIDVQDTSLFEKLEGLIDSVLVSPDPVSICEFFTVIAKFNQLPDSAQATVAGQIESMNFGNLVGKAVYHAFELGFITNEQVFVDATKGATASQDSSQTITVVDEADILNTIRNTIIADLQNEPDFSEFDVVEELPQIRGFTGPTILLETISAGSEAQGHDNFTLSSANFRFILLFPDGKFKNVAGDILDRSDLAQYYLGILTKVLNNVDLRAFDIDEKQVFQQTHMTPSEDLKFWGCTAVLAITYRGICS